VWMGHIKIDSDIEDVEDIDGSSLWVSSRLPPGARPSLASFLPCPLNLGLFYGGRIECVVGRPVAL
jgi:hypothetical protein